MLDRFVAPLAKRDLESIFHFIAADDEKAAWRVILRLENTIRLLSERPFLGQSLKLPEDLGLRKMSVPPYIVFYRCSEIVVEIVRVLHSARDLTDPRLFRSK